MCQIWIDTHKHPCARTHGHVHPISHTRTTCDTVGTFKWICARDVIKYLQQVMLPIQATFNLFMHPACNTDSTLNSSTPGQNWDHFADDILNAFPWRKSFVFHSNFTDVCFKSLICSESAETHQYVQQLHDTRDNISVLRQSQNTSLHSGTEFLQNCICIFGFHSLQIKVQF